MRGLALPWGQPGACGLWPAWRYPSMGRVVSAVVHRRSYSTSSLVHAPAPYRFSAYRDHLLLGTWLYTAAYSRTQLAPRQLLGWLGVLGLALPMRFFRLLPLTLLASAQLLHAVTPRQLVHTVVLPLACSWYFEAHSRAAFVHANLSAPRSRRV